MIGGHKKQLQALEEELQAAKLAIKNLTRGNHQLLDQNDQLINKLRRSEAELHTAVSSQSAEKINAERAEQEKHHQTFKRQYVALQTESTEIIEQLKQEVAQANRARDNAKAAFTRLKKKIAKLEASST